MKYHFWKHFRTIRHHKHLVVKNCFACGLYLQGLMHDLSKYAPVEFLNGAHFFMGSFSPNKKEREIKGYSEAWMHHKGRNKHHAEYWNDWSVAEQRYVPVPMPDRYIAESLCDRVAASKNYNGDAFTPDKPLEYFDTRNDASIMHPATAARMRELLVMYRDRGEKETFRYVRRWLKGRENAD